MYVFGGTPAPLISEPTKRGVVGATLSMRVLPLLVQALGLPQMMPTKETKGLPTASTTRLLGRKGTAVETSVHVDDPVAALKPSG